MIQIVDKYLINLENSNKSTHYSKIHIFVIKFEVNFVSSEIDIERSHFTHTDSSAAVI